MFLIFLLGGSEMVIKKKMIVLAVMTWVAVSSSISIAACISCKTSSGSELVCSGQSTFDLTSKCGNPDSSDSRDKIVTDNSGRVQSIRIDTYYYNCGAGTSTKAIEFVDGRLTSIRNGDEGSGPEKCW